jgi:hypothetical protein
MRTDIIDKGKIDFALCDQPVCLDVPIRVLDSDFITIFLQEVLEV